MLYPITRSCLPFLKLFIQGRVGLYSHGTFVEFSLSAFNLILKNTCDDPASLPSRQH